MMACVTTCTDGSGTVHEAGDTWPASDGCNTETCESDGTIERTDLGCVASCTDETGTYSEGDTWTCPDGCNTCTCEPDGTISTTLVECEG
jgi:hypothetical protein